MEAERRKNRSTVKRTPFSDLTNTLILDRSSTKSQIPKPYNSSLKSNSKSVNPNFSISDSTFGSSNINNVQNPTTRPVPQPLLSTPPPPAPQPSSYSPNHYNRDGSGPLVIYSRAEITKRSKRRKEDDSSASYTDPSLEKTRGKEKEISSTLGYNLVEKAKDKGNSLFVLSSPPSSGKMKAKGKAIDPGDHNPEENEERGAMAVRETQSCPPQRISRNNRKQFNEAVESLLPMLQTDPCPTKKKRLPSSQEDDVQPVALPQDFVQQQRAYFKEVDDFELLEEEVSDKWLGEEE